MAGCETPAKPKALTVEPEKTLDLSDPAQRAARKKKLAMEGLNEFCDPVKTVYAGGNPLFDSASGQTKSLERYLLEKRVNQWCRSIPENSGSRSE